MKNSLASLEWIHSTRLLPGDLAMRLPATPFITAFALLVAVTCWTSDSHGAGVAAGAAAEPPGIKVGDKPLINWKTTDGKAVTNAALKGRIVIVDFWATWCKPCMAEAPHMVKLSQDYADKGVSILGVSLDDDSSVIPPVAKAKGFTWPQVLNASQPANPATAWGVSSIPRTFILGPDGELVWSGHPAMIDQPLADAVKKYAAVVTATKKTPEPAAPETAPSIPVVHPVPPPPPAATGPSAALVEARLAAADKDREAKRDIDAYGKYKWIVEHAAGTPSADSAAPRVKEYEANPDFMAALKQSQQEQAASSDLWVAENLIKAGKLDEGRKMLAEVAKKYPDTASGRKAATLVDVGP